MMGMVKVQVDHAEAIAAQQRLMQAELGLIRQIRKEWEENRARAPAGETNDKESAE